MARKNKIDEELYEAKKQRFEKIAGNLETLPADKFLKDNFLPYSWSYVLDRALVDVTGLKPVQRRILYTMYKNGLSPNANKSVIATIGGDVIHFHPHGDASINDALKNLGRAHVFRVPVIDTSGGDFGSPGSPGAAARYLKTRLNRAGWINVEEIGENAVRMVPNYDNKDVEPVKLPVKWPVSIVNGGSGIATGYASNMPSHNPTEIMKASKLLLRNPDSTHAAIQKIILGPDFNMGGLITTNDGIKQYLETGSGSFKIRGQYEVTQGARSTNRIEFYEIPFGTYPEKIIQEIQKASDEKGQFKEVSSYKDLSDLKHPIRVVIETKPSVNHKKVIQDLFKYTSLEVSFAANITTIVDNRPVQSSMKELLLDFIKFRKECVFNKSNYSLNKKEARLHLIEGLTLVLLDIDKAIAIIRNSEDIAEANAKLQKTFKIDEKQADHVLSLQLRRLTKMDKGELLNEKSKLEEEIEYLRSLISDDEVMKNHLLKEFDETLKIIGDERKTDINGVSAEEFAAQEKAVAQELKNADKDLPCYITRFSNGKVMKTMEPFSYIDGTKKFANSLIVEQIKMRTKESLVFVDNKGNGYKVPMSYLVENKLTDAKAAGLTLPKGASIVGIAKYESMKSDIGLALGTKLGSVKIAKTDFPKSDEFPVINLDEGDEIVGSRWLGKALTDTYFTFVSKAGQVLIFDAKTIRETGSKAGGVRGMKLKGDDDAVIFFGWIDSVKKPENVLLTYSGHTIKRTSLTDIPTKGKGGMGVATQLFKKGEDELKAAYIGGENSIAATEKTNQVVSLPPIIKRSARGVDFSIDVAFGSSAMDSM